MTSYIGIDPGNNGGIAIIHGIEIAQVIPMPMHEKELDVYKFMRWIKASSIEGEIYACVEKTFQPNNLVRMEGLIKGLLICMCIPTTSVAVQTWRKQVLGNYRATKQDAIEWCLKHYPDVELKRTPRSKKYHDGIAEALVIAEYCRRIHTGE